MYEELGRPLVLTYLMERDCTGLITIALLLLAMSGTGLLASCDGVERLPWGLSAGRPVGAGSLAVSMGC